MPKVTFEVKNVRHSKAKLVKLDKDRNTAAHSASVNKVVTNKSSLVTVAERHLDDGADASFYTISSISINGAGLSLQKLVKVALKMYNMKFVNNKFM